MWFVTLGQLLRDSKPLKLCSTLIQLSLNQSLALVNTISVVPPQNLLINLGIMTDLLAYSIIIPVFPFRLESLGYTGVPEHVSWLLLAYVSHH